MNAIAGKAAPRNDRPMSIYSFKVARALAGSIALSIASASVADAQQIWSPFVGLGSISSAGRTSAATGASAFVVEPGALIESPRGSMLTRWSAPVAATSVAITDADLAGRFRVASSKRFETSIFASASYDHTTFNTMANASSSARLQLGTLSPERGLQWSAGIDGWRSNINGNGVIVPATSISGWIRRFGLSFSAELTARGLPGSTTVRGDTIGHSWIMDSIALRRAAAQLHNDTLGAGSSPIFPFSAGPPIYASKSVSDDHAFGDATLRVSGMLMAFGIDGQAGMGVATGGRTRTYGSVILTRWISPGFALTGGVVVQPPEPGAVGGRTGGLLGIRLAPGPQFFPHFANAPKVGASACTVRIADGSATIEVRAPSANHVELSGDFTRWTPASLEHGSGDRWTITTRLAPGIHRFVVRVDGGSWLPAPGLPQTVDSYEGTVSVIVSP
jgi:hypothetical protein